MTSGTVLACATCALPKTIPPLVRASRHVVHKFDSNSPMGLYTPRWLRHTCPGFSSSKYGTPDFSSLNPTLVRAYRRSHVISRGCGGSRSLPFHIGLQPGITAESFHSLLKLRLAVAPFSHSTTVPVQTVLRGTDNALMGTNQAYTRGEHYFSP